MPIKKEAASIRGPVYVHQSVPSFNNQVTRFVRGCGSELDRILVGTDDDEGSLRTIGGQAPEALGIDLRPRTLTAPWICAKVRLRGKNGSAFTARRLMALRSPADAMVATVSTSRGAPPRMGTAKIEEAVSWSEDLGVETYKISDPSGVSLGCESCSAAVTSFSANGRSVACLKISEVPFRSESNKTSVLSGVHDVGMLALSSRVSRLYPSNAVLSGANVPM